MTGDWIFPAVLSVLFVLLGLFAFALDEYPAVSLFFDRPARRRKRDLVTRHPRTGKPAGLRLRLKASGALGAKTETEAPATGSSTGSDSEVRSTSRPASGEVMWL